jgi:hypothetical protein
MIKKHLSKLRPIWAILILFVVFMVGCNMSPEELQESEMYPTEFIVEEESDLQVVSFNGDVDSVTFLYKTSITDETAFWGEIEHLVEERQWKELDGEGSIRRYEYLSEGPVVLDFFSAEEIRIAYDVEQQKVIVAWVQSDTSDKVDSFEDANPVEVGFAQESVWPEFEELARSHGIED